MPDKNQAQRRAIDHIDFSREEDEVWNSEAEIKSHKMLYAIYRDVQVMKVKLNNMEEMFLVLSNTKGFITIMRWIGKLAFWLVATGAAIAGLWYAFKRAILGE